MNEKTATDHAATVRKALLRFYPGKDYNMAEVALAALVAQAETAADWKLRGDEAEHSLGHCRGLLEAAEERIQDAKYVGFNRMQQRAEAAEAERDAAVRTAEQAREALQRGIDIAAQYLDTGRGDLDGWIESTRAALTKDTP